MKTLNEKKTLTTKSSYTYCTYCKKEVELVDKGMPISGSDFRCEFCDRMDYDMYDNKLGVEYRERNIILWKKNDDVKEFIKDLKEELCEEMVTRGRGGHLDRITQERIWDTINKRAGFENGKRK